MSTIAQQPDRPARERVAALDILRGLVMVLMALDHVRVFSGVPAGGATPGLFFTRWVTNFCAPAFVFLAGTGAWLHASALDDRGAMSRYLVERGALLIACDLTINRLSWTFNLDFYNYNVANVLWTIGWAMIALAALSHLSVRAVATIGLAIIGGHNLLDALPDETLQAIQQSPFDGAWQVMYGAFSDFRLFGSGPTLVILYSIVPWVGVLAAGYAFGAVMQFDAARRRRWCLRIGVGAIVLFVVLRAANSYGNPTPWRMSGKLPPLLSFLSVSKYPASLQFLLMTLGPVIASIPWLDQIRGRLVDVLRTFGRVPLFYYLLHIPVIHVVAVLISLVRTPSATPWLFLNHPVRNPPPPDGYAWSLGLLYCVTAAIVIALYFPCRWYADRKARGPRTWWTTYL